MTTRLTLEDCARIARKIWYGQDSRGFHRMIESKWSEMPTAGIDGTCTDFPFPNGVWTSLDSTYEMLISYPKWDFPGQIQVRRLSPNNTPHQIRAKH